MKPNERRSLCERMMRSNIVTIHGNRNGDERELANKSLESIEKSFFDEPDTFTTNMVKKYRILHTKRDTLFRTLLNISESFRRAVYRSKYTLTEKQTRSASGEATINAQALYENLVLLADMQTLWCYDKGVGRGIRTTDIGLHELRIAIGELVLLLREHESWINKNGVLFESFKPVKNPAAHQANIGCAKRDLVKRLNNLWSDFLEKQENPVPFIQDICEFVEGKRSTTDVISKRLRD
jgi:hypothetical protein